MRKLLCLAVLMSMAVGCVFAEISITQPGGGGGGGSDPVAQAAAAAAQATANNAISNRGVQINGSFLTNGASITITGSSGGGISNVIVNGKTGVLSGSGSNIVSTVTLVATDVGAVATNGDAVALTNFPPLVVQTNQTDVTFAGLRTYLTSGPNLTPSSPGYALRILDSGLKMAAYIDDTRHELYGTNGTSTTASWSDVLRAYDSSGANGVAVRQEITNTAQQVTNNASPYQPWTATLSPPASGGTTLVTYANGTLPLLVCTGACTVGVNPAGGWGANGVNRFTLGLYIGSFSVTVTNAGARWGNTLTLSTTRTNQLLYRSVGTNDWVVYGSL